MSGKVVLRPGGKEPRMLGPLRRAADSLRPLCAPW